MDVRNIVLFAFILGNQSISLNAQFDGFNGDFNGFNGGDSNSNINNFGNGNPFSPFSSFFTTRFQILTAHAVLASLAFVLLFPAGGILIRLASFRGLWLVHGAFQLLAFAAYIAAMAMGIYMAQNLRMLSEPHAVIGLILFALLSLEPFLGLCIISASREREEGRGSSYAHLGIGRIVITLGIINGGLGLQLAKRTGIGAPSGGQIVAYSVVAAVCWLAYVGAVIVGRGGERGMPGGTAANVEGVWQL